MAAQKRALRPAHEKHQIKMMDAPPAKTVVNKGFLPFVEEMISFYLNESPVLRTQPSKIVSQESEISLAKDVVYKIANEQNGLGVYISSMLNEAEKSKAEEQVKKWFREQRALY